MRGGVGANGARAPLAFFLMFGCGGGLFLVAEGGCVGRLC